MKKKRQNIFDIICMYICEDLQIKHSYDNRLCEFIINYKYIFYYIRLIIILSIYYIFILLIY